MYIVHDSSDALLLYIVMSTNAVACVLLSVSYFYCRRKVTGL